MAGAKRGTALTVFAILFTLLAVSNMLKGLELDEQTGFVLFGQRLAGAPNVIFGLLFGVFLLVYAFGIWGMRRFSLPMSYAYAAYVVVNLILYGSSNPRPPGTGYLVFMIVYSVVAIGVSAGTAILLSRRKAELV